MLDGRKTEARAERARPAWQRSLLCSSARIARIRSAGRARQPRFSTSTSSRWRSWRHPEHAPAPTAITQGHVRLVGRASPQSPAFEALAASTARTRQPDPGTSVSTNRSSRVRPWTFREFPLKEMTPKAIRVLRDRKKTTPAAAQVRMKTLRVMFDWATEECEDWVATNIVSRRSRASSIQHRRSSLVDAATSPSRSSSSAIRSASKARLAMALMLYTGVRRSDAVQARAEACRERTQAESCGSGSSPTKTERTSGKGSFKSPSSLRSRRSWTPLISATSPFWKRNTASRSPRPALWQLVPGALRRGEVAQVAARHGLRKIGAVIVSERGATGAAADGDLRLGQRPAGHGLRQEGEPEDDGRRRHATLLAS